MRYQQGRFREAAAVFERVGSTGDASAAAEAQYWRARALEHAGDRDAARHLYETIVADAPASYYAHWAELRLGRPSTSPHAISAPALPRAIGATPAGADPYHWVRAGELQAMGLHPQARTELRAFARAYSNDPGMTAPIVQAYQSVDGYREAIRLAHEQGLTDPSIFFPLAYWPQLLRQTHGADIDPLLVLALMRQESMFDPTAHSPADARGLMQLLPSTAEAVASRTGQPSPSGKLYDPDVNISLGIAHLQELLAAYQGDQVKTLAAYNGGEEAVARWQRRFGTLEPDEFVESITYRETRDYVKRVLGNYRRYQQEYGAR
jgi:soluble lytic murein transglycosylase